MAERSLRHDPVMLEEVLDLFGGSDGGDYLDLTLGGGGHAQAILEHHPRARLTGVDRDAKTLAATSAKMEQYGQRFRGFHVRFDLVDQVVGGGLEGAFDGILMDLGMSSMQVDDPSRGFGFEADADLDMRMDRSGGETAADLLRRLSEKDLADLLFQFGDERRSRAIARRVVERRRQAPIRRTSELVDLVCRVLGGPRRGRIHPATRTFQALRIAVNDELGCLGRALPKCVGWLRKGGVMAAISFHSGEDRLVKRFFREHHGGSLEVLTRKPLRPSERELDRNRRSRSAKLRAARRRGSAGESPGPAPGSPSWISGS